MEVLNVILPSVYLRLLISLNDDEEILIGAYKGKKYGDVKSDNEFKEFIKGLKNSKIAFGDAERMAQLTKLKQLADAV